MKKILNNILYYICLILVLASVVGLLRIYTFSFPIFKHLLLLDYGSAVALYFFLHIKAVRFVDELFNNNTGV